MRWILLFATLLAWLACVTRHGAGALGFWLFVGIVGAIATALAFAQTRIEARARPETMFEATQAGKNRGTSSPS